MSAALHLAGREDAGRLMPLVAAFHAAAGVQLSDADRAAAVAPLLEGSPHGAVWLIGPRKSPVGYIALSFGWSIADGGMQAGIDEFFIRENVRGRGMGTEVLSDLRTELSGNGFVVFHTTLWPGIARASGLFRRLQFSAPDETTPLRWPPRG